MFRLICLGAALLLLVSGCGSEDTPTRHNDFVPLTSIEIVAAAPSLAARTSTPLAVIGNFSGQFTSDVTDQAVWSSNAPTVAGFITAGSPNRVTGVAPGTAMVTATVGSVSANFGLTVTSAKVTALTITPAAPAVPKGLMVQFTANGTFSNGSVQDLTFDSAWASSAPGVATVSDAAASKGSAQAMAVGAATVDATFDGVTGTTLLTVTELVLQSITVAPANPTILSISRASFSATGRYSDGSTVDITSQAAWASSKTDVATVTTGGSAKTVAPGTTTISAGLNGVSGSTNLKVTGGRLTGIVLSPAILDPVIDTIVPLTATGSFSNGSSRDITGGVDWSVTSATIARVTTPGGNVALLNALAVPFAAIPVSVKAAAGAVSAETSLTVTAPRRQSLQISPNFLDLIEGTSKRFTATATFDDGTTQDVTASSEWTSGATSTASVDNTGLAKGRVHGVTAAGGSVIITADFGGMRATAPVTVKARTLVTLTIAGPSAVTVGTGNQVKFSAKATYSDSSVLDVTEDATWTIDMPNVAILADSQNQPGQVVAVDGGSATLTASFGGKSQTVTLLVP